MRTILLIGWWLGWATCVSAQAPAICVVCKQPLSGRHFKINSPSIPGQPLMCETCAKWPDHCAVCGLPVKMNFVQLGDGRLLCEFHSAEIVLAQPEAQSVFAEVKRDLHRLLAGTDVLPDRNITVCLVDHGMLEKLFESRTSTHDKSTIQGLTHTRSVGGKRYEHIVYLLSGLSRARLAAVAAHEYAHTWINENLPADRKLARDAIEGFCELIAYKLMVERNEPLETRSLLANEYTHGQIHAFVKADADYQLWWVLRWMLAGEDVQLNLADLDRLRIVRSGSTQPLTWQPGLAILTPVPDTLLLRGLSGPAQRRLALINDCTLALNEEGRVRVGTSNVTVRCLAISNDAVVIRVNGAAEVTRLALRAH